MKQPQFLEEFEKEYPGKWAETVAPQIEVVFQKMLKAFQVKHASQLG